MVKQYGFIEPSKKELKKSKDAGYVFGSAKNINPSGDWKPYYPNDERQFNRNIDSYGCTIFGTLNAIECLAKLKYNEDWDKAERFVGAFADMKPSGNTPHKVADTIRSVGNIPQGFMPLEEVKDFEELWDKEEAKKHKDIGEKWLKGYDFKHEWVSNNQIEEALKDSPLGVAVYAWVQDDDGMYYQPEGSSPTHWTMLGAKRDGYYEIYDSYPPYIKQMPLDTKFAYIKKYELSRSKPTWLSKRWVDFLEWITKVINRLKN